ncbi:MAG: hypothetical protein ACFWT0_08310 [Bifidobacterium crudilactis]
MEMKACCVVIVPEPAQKTKNEWLDISMSASEFRIAR